MGVNTLGGVDRVEAAAAVPVFGVVATFSPGDTEASLPTSGRAIFKLTSAPD